MKRATVWPRSFRIEPAGYVPQVSGSYFFNMKSLAELPNYGFNLSAYGDKEFDKSGISIVFGCGSFGTTP